MTCPFMFLALRSSAVEVAVEQLNLMNKNSFYRRLQIGTLPKCSDLVISEIPWMIPSFPSCL